MISVTAHVCVWRYAPLAVHATQEEEEEEVTAHGSQIKS